MARIRSIKPEFWKDGKVLRLTEPCALFFIGLWNFCDDEGKCANDSFELASNMPRFRSQHVSRWIQNLFEVGLIQLSTDFRWISVTNWNHQKIDRPRIPSVLKSEIEWLPVVTEKLSANARRMIDDASTNDRRKDRIGEERKGSDRIRRRSAKRGEKKPAEPGFSLTAQAFSQDLIARYFELWEKKYQGRAPLMPPDFKKLKDLSANLGHEVAVGLLESYFAMPDSWFLTKRHDVQSLMSNLAKVQHFAGTGKTVTSRDAKASETSQSLANQLERLGGAV